MPLASLDSASQPTLDYAKSAPKVPSLRLDILSAYIVTVARVMAWIVVTAMVYRQAGEVAFAFLALVQSTVGLLEYAAIGVAPAIIRLTAEALREVNAERGALESSRRRALSADVQIPGTDSFHSSEPPHRAPQVQAVYANGFAMALLTAAVGFVVLIAFTITFRHSKIDIDCAGAASELVLMVGIGTLIRMTSDAAGAALQTCGKIFLDNVLLTIREVIWGGGTAIGLYMLHLPWQRATGYFLIGGDVILLSMRAVFSHFYGSGLFERWWNRLDRGTIIRMLLFGGMVVAAQLADFLYAPTNNILILNFLGKSHVAVYAPAVQIDGGYLLLTGALATVLLPRTALAHSAGDKATIRRYYIRGTLATFLVLLVTAPFVWLASPYFYRLWLGNPMDATVAILWMVLIHTVIGGSSAVGRSILLAIGKVRPFTISVLIGGVGNVILSVLFVGVFHMGLPGIILGTIIAVTCRCAIWMPWYTLRTIKSEAIQVVEPEPA